MKKTCFAVIIVALTIAFCGCNADTPDTSSVQEQSESFADKSGLKMYMAQSEYPMGTEVLVAYVENPTEFDAGLGTGWLLERYEGESGFQPVPYEEPPAFKDIWRMLPPNSRQPLSAGLHYFGDNIQPGRYRLTATGVTMDSVGSGSLSAEFTIK